MIRIVPGLADALYADGALWQRWKPLYDKQSAIRHKYPTLKGKVKPMKAKRILSLLLCTVLMIACLPLGASALEEEQTSDYRRFYITLHTNLPNGTDEALNLGDARIYYEAGLNFPASDYITSPYKWKHADGTAATLNQITAVGGKRYFLINYSTAANPGPNDRTLEYTDIISKAASTNPSAPTVLYCQWVELKEPYVIFFATNADEGMPLYEVYTGIGGAFTVPNHHYYTWDDGSGRKTYVSAWLPGEIYSLGADAYSLEDGWLPGEKVTVTKNAVMRPKYGDWYVNLHFLNQKDQATVWNYYPVLSDAQVEWGDWSRRSAYSGIARETFRGWSASIDGSGTLYTIENNVQELMKSEIHDLYAVYSDTKTYAIRLEKPAHGTLTCERGSAMQGATVYVTALPDEGYGHISYDEFALVSVVDASGNKVPITIANQTKYPHQFYFTMPDQAVTVSVTFPENPDHTPSGLQFTDVPKGAYYADAVAWAVEKKITSGTSATTFSPGSACTRAQAVTFLWRAAGSPAPQSSVNPFTDVPAGKYYTDAVLWAVENKITSGTSATSFSPDATCSRAQIVTFQYRAVGSPSVERGASFADVGENQYYADAVKWAVENEITSGTSATTFSPNSYCTRGQIVTFLYRDRA